MSNVDHDRTEDLLRHASPRPAPSPAEEAAVRAAVQKEWQATARERRTRRRVMQYALAATVVLAAFLAFNAFRTQTAPPIAVGTIAKNFGAVYLLGESSKLKGTGDLTTVLAGQTVVTETDAGLAIAWTKGGSLRVDENSRLAFIGPGRIRLESGRVYFDSVTGPLQPADPAANTNNLVLETTHGEVQHVGTQYMVRVDQQSLVVSVREGQVDVQGRYHREAAVAGEQVTMTGSAQPSVLSIGRSGDAWAWIGRTTPAADMDGKTLHEFLVWACREMGLELRYEGDAEERAREFGVFGTVDTEPAKAVRQRLATMALDWRIEEGVITISD